MSAWQQAGFLIAAVFGMVPVLGVVAVYRIAHIKPENLWLLIPLFLASWIAAALWMDIDLQRRRLP